MIAPTCTQGGYTEHTCSVCAYRFRDTETAATGHAYVWADSGDGANHTGSCPNPVCPEPEVTEAHAWGPWGDRSDVTGHVRVCGVCGGEETSLHRWEYTDNADGVTHTKACAVGGESAGQPHDWTTGDTCVCGAEKPAPAPVAEFTYGGSGVNFSIRWAPKPDTVISTGAVQAFVSIDTSPPTIVLITLKKGADGIWITDTAAALTTEHLVAGTAYTATFDQIFQGAVNDGEIEAVGATLTFTYQP